MTLSAEEARDLARDAGAPGSSIDLSYVGQGVIDAISDYFTSQILTPQPSPVPTQQPVPPQAPSTPVVQPPVTVPVVPMPPPPVPSAPVGTPPVSSVPNVPVSSNSPYVDPRLRDLTPTDKNIVRREGLPPKPGSPAARDLDDMLRRMGEPPRQSPRSRAIGRGIFGRMVGGIFGVLFPDEIAPGTLDPDEILDAERRKRQQDTQISEIARDFPKRIAQSVPQTAPTPKRITQDQLKEITVNRARLPTPTPTPTPTTTGTKTTPGQAPRSKRAIDIGLGLLPLLLPSVRSKSATTSLPRIVPGIDPLTPVNPRAVPSPGANPFRQNPQNRYCESLKTKKRKKQRDCKQRGNVAWTSGPNRGKIAGTKCMEFK